MDWPAAFMIVVLACGVLGCFALLLWMESE